MGFFRTATRLIGGHLFTYQAGTSTPAAAYHDAAATMPHQNPITLDDRGEALVYITEAMLWGLETPHGVQLWRSITLASGVGRLSTIPPSTVGVDHPDVRLALSARRDAMSRLFYHVMQDNAGNLLFDVSRHDAHGGIGHRSPPSTGTRR